MLKKFVCGLVALGSLGLFGADNAINSSEGTWKLNEAKSKFAKGHESKDVTIVVRVAGETSTVTLNGIGGFFGLGPDKPFNVKFTMPTAGGPLSYDNPPPAGLIDTLKVIDDRTSDIVSTMNGKQIQTTHIVISADHKRMVNTVSGVDEKGQAFKNVEVFEHQ